MAVQNNKKRILCLMEILLHQTDEDHILNASDLAEILKNKYGIEADRRTIYTEVAVLQDFGLDVVQVRGKTKGYYIGSRDFEFAEVKLLVDTVQSSKFITEKKSRELIGKLEQLCSESQAKQLNPHIQVIAVEPAGANCLEVSLEKGEVCTLPEVTTIADGTAVKKPGEKIFPYLKENIDEVITIEDDELIVAFLDIVENHKMVVENSGLLTVAALRHLEFTGKKVVCVLSGGNMDMITMASVVQHGLIQRDRIFTVSVLLPDKPWELVRVSTVIAENQGNVIKLDHNQFVSTNRNAAVELKITVEAFGTEHKRQLVAALEQAGFRPKVIRPNL